MFRSSSSLSVKHMLEAFESLHKEIVDILDLWKVLSNPFFFFSHYSLFSSLLLAFSSARSSTPCLTGVVQPSLWSLHPFHRFIWQAQAVDGQAGHESHPAAWLLCYLSIRCMYLPLWLLFFVNLLIFVFFFDVPFSGCCICPENWRAPNSFTGREFWRCPQARRRQKVCRLYFTPFHKKDLTGFPSHLQAQPPFLWRDCQMVYDFVWGIPRARGISCRYQNENWIFKVIPAYFFPAFATIPNQFFLKASARGMRPST